MSDDEADLWPVLLSEIVGDTLSDPDVSPALFSVVVALTVVEQAKEGWLDAARATGRPIPKPSSRAALA